MSNNQISTNILMKKQRLLKTALGIITTKEHILINKCSYRICYKTCIPKFTKVWIQYIPLCNWRIKVIKLYRLSDFKLNEQLTKYNL